MLFRSGHGEAGMESEEGTQTPSLPRTPSRLRRAPQRFCQSEVERRHAHSLWVAAVWGRGWLGCTRPFHRKARSIVVTEPIQVRSDFTRLRVLPPNTLTCSYYFDIPTNMPRQNQILWVTGFSGTAFGWSSFLTSVSRRSLELRSAPSVNPACAALRGAHPKTAPCSLPRPQAPLRSGD